MLFVSAGADKALAIAGVPKDLAKQLSAGALAGCQCTACWLALLWRRLFGAPLHFVVCQQHMRSCALRRPAGMLSVVCVV